MDDETYLDRTQRRITLRDGQSLSNDDMVAGFMLYAPEKRVDILEAIDKDLGSGTNLRKMASNLQTRRQLGEMHAALRKANR